MAEDAAIDNIASAGDFIGDANIATPPDGRIDGCLTGVRWMAVVGSTNRRSPIDNC
jgi:hypothetical protein